ncbi:MAG: YkgJ family cysteine cluster protein, partial [Desulfobacterales bacterium]|nr:YkgJ family cysteine cluster protein [Desulfobacterales bacterium]
PFEPVEDTVLVFYLIHVLETGNTDPENMAQICTILFQAPAIPGKVDGRTGVWIVDQMNEFVCKRCGNCCRGLEHQCDPDDTRLWELHQRTDILSWVGQEGAVDGWDQCRIWVDPKNGRTADECPFLAPVPGKHIFRCKIQTVKPRVCREYPFTRKHARFTGCQGFDMPL